MMTYRVRARGGRFESKYDVFLLGISIGQLGHEGEKFRATLEWLSKRFARGHIWIADTLHRHNRMFEFGERIEEAHARTRVEGEQWLRRHATEIAELGIPVSVSHWDDWIGSPEFEPTRANLQGLYDSHEELRAVVDRDAARYLSRCSRRGLAINDRDFASRKCVELILEECAVLSLLISAHDGVDVYPGSELETTRYIRQTVLAEAPQSLLRRRFTRILFRRQRAASTGAGDGESAVRVRTIEI